ncbi:hypothetical protein VTJ83DRAFT_688 [Remersonia thermophila]|uniref:Small ribosomal subunit protein mS38 n=1 Tax=Remersonia thermophila TaxID=72144 RepID=A0ABR4DLX5_9PEZI
MLPSVRRVVAAAAPSSPAVSSLASSAPRAAAYSVGLRKTGLHQRRYSSSKPSSPDDGSRDFAPRPVPASRGSKSEKKAKAPVPQPPSVPSTRHIGDEGLALSTFFALHRPISVTQLLPKTVSEDDFAQIFATRSRHNRVSDVLSTLSQTVHDLEEPLSKLSLANREKQQQQQQQQTQEPSDDGSARLSLKHPDGSETNLHFQFNPLAGQYLPYAPPPPPEPLADEDAAAAAGAAAAEVAADAAGAAASEPLVEAAEPQTRVYKAVVTIEETLEADGQVKVVAHSPELIEDEGDRAPRTFLERMWRRQMRYDDACRRQDRPMQAISVRRIRKLKMKKKKYKKLMRRTRNQRRKLDRL